MLPILRNDHNKEDVLSLKERERKTENSSRTFLCRNLPYNGKNTYCSNHSQGVNMPIILNVFSLSDAPDSGSKEMTRNISQENNIPVTPPCSPPLRLIELGTTSIISENFGSCNGSGMCSPYGFTSRPNNASVNPAVTHNYYNKNVTRCPQEITNGLTGQLPQLQNHKRHTIEHRPNKKTAQYSSNVVNSYFTRNDDVLPHSGKHAIVHSNKYLPAQKKRYVSPESDESLKRKKAHCDSEKKIPARRQYVFAKLVQHIQRNQNAKIKSTNEDDNIELNFTNEQPKSSCHTISNDLDNQQCSDQNMEETFGKYSTQQQHQYSELLPHISFASKLSSMKDRNAFLSPREVRVLQLKKRLEEQQLALMKLHVKNH